MSASIPTYFAAAIFACFAQQTKATLTNSGVSVHTSFIANARLDAAELSNVVKVANMCGIQQVAEVRTFYYLPTSSRGIEVTGADHVSGRNVTYQTLEIFREGWFYKAKPAGTLQAISVGPFWVDGLGFPTTHKATLFDTVNGSIRLQVGAGISTNDADTIISAFTSTNFLVRESQGIGSVDWPLIKSENLSRPNMLMKAETKDHYLIWFSEGLNYECVVSSNKVWVLSFRYPPTP